jgi:hypothetical protein
MYRERPYTSGTVTYLAFFSSQGCVAMSFFVYARPSIRLHAFMNAVAAPSKVSVGAGLSDTERGKTGPDLWLSPRFAAAMGEACSALAQ